MGDTLKEIGGRVRVRREELGWSLADVARKAGVTKQQLSRIEKGTSGTREPTLRQLGEALGMSWPWPLEDGGAVSQPTSRAEEQLLGLLRNIPPRVRQALDLLISRLAEQAAPAELPATSVVLGDELASRREALSGHVLVRLVGHVAAREESAVVDFDSRLPDEEDVPDELVQEGCGLVRVEGSSMGEVAPDGSLLLVKPAELGGYAKGDVVIAATPRGQVCKVYGGQGGAASPKQPAGVIVLKSVAPGGEDIIAPKAEDDLDGINVQAVAYAVRPARGQWGTLRRPLSSRWR